MTENKKKNKFIKVPEYPGGKMALMQFIAQNLKYPQEAIQNKTEGFVHLKIEIGYNGSVDDAVVVHGLGSGCDEEAIRVVKLLKFSAAKNRGLKVKSSKRIKIYFKLPQKKVSVNYHYTSKTATAATAQQTPKPQNNATYSYSITVKKKT